jgi:hypothetical protein
LISMIAAFGAEDPFERKVCGKRCYNAVVKAQRQMTTSQAPKKRIPWHNDGPTNSVSSLSVLIKWMTDGNNYSRYRGGEGQSGETKQTLAGEVSQAIRDSGVMTARMPKDVMSKSLALEASFRATSDWLNNTGQGVQNETDLRAAILQKCPTFYELQPIMDDSPSTHPLLLNTQSGFSYSDRESDCSSSCDEENGSSRVDSVRALHPAQSTSGTNTTAANSPPAASSATATTTTSTPRQKPEKRSCGGLTTIASGRKSTKIQRETLAGHAKLVELKEAQLAQQKLIELEELSIKREDLVLRQLRSTSETQETEARIAEANANAFKLQEEAKHWRMQRMVALLRERTKLKAEGVSQAELDLVLPLPSLIPASPELPTNMQAADYDALHQQHP